MNPGQSRRHYFLARLQTSGHRADQTGDTGPLERLRDMVIDALGAGDELVFLVGCAIEEIRSKDRDAAASARAWRRLRAAAERHLPPTHLTMMSLRAYEARYVRLRGRPGDLDEGLRLYVAEHRLRLATLGADNYRTAIIHANLAAALRDRGRPADLAESERILREEVALRTTRYGTDHAFTWDARALLARTLLAAGTAAEPLVIASGLLAVRRDRFGRRDPATLYAHLLYAHALLAAGQMSDAAREVRYVSTAVPRGVGAVDTAWLADLKRQLGSAM